MIRPIDLIRRVLDSANPDAEKIALIRELVALDHEFRELNRAARAAFRKQNARRSVDMNRNGTTIDV